MPAALLTACGDGHSEADTPEALPIPEPTGEGQALMKAKDLAIGSRALAPAKDPSGKEVGVLLFRKDEKTVLAYSNVCTHQGCA
ncbi:MAG: Rieske 2Fe-2S domain-containing protein, partial [Glutamicibacter sp.]